MDILPLDCECGCAETEQRNVYTEDIGGIPTEVEYDLYCKNRGKYLEHFAYGHWGY